MSSRPTMASTSSRFDPRPNAASRSTRCSHSAPCSCQARAASSGSPNSPPVPATPWTSWTARPSAMSTAGSSSQPGRRSQRPHPVVEELRAGVTGLLRVELGRGQSGPFSTAATKAAPCSAQVTTGATAANDPSGCSDPALRGIRVDEVEALVLDAGEEPRAGTPGFTVDQPMCGTTAAGQPVDEAGPLTEPVLGRPCSTARSSRRTSPASRRRRRGPGARRPGGRR